MLDDRVGEHSAKFGKGSFGRPRYPFAFAVDFHAPQEFRQRLVEMGVSGFEIPVIDLNGNLSGSVDEGEPLPVVARLSHLYAPFPFLFEKEKSPFPVRAEPYSRRGFCKVSGSPFLKRQDGKIGFFPSARVFPPNSERFFGKFPFRDGSRLDPASEKRERRSV